MCRKKPPKASKKCLRKLFPFHEYGKVWNARQVIVLTSNQSLTDNAIWKVGRFQGGIQVGKNLLKLTSDKISTIAQHTIFVYFKKKFMKYFKNSMGSIAVILDYHLQNITVCPKSFFRRTRR